MKHFVSIEYVRWLQEERAKINRMDLNDIVFFENGNIAMIAQATRNKFAMSGLNNTDFITSGYYKQVFIIPD